MIEYSAKRICFVAAVIAVFICGCSADPYSKVSGTVTFKGEPVPKGEIRFTPDSTQGNKGPSVTAIIRDGKYETPSEKGIVGGKYQLRIMGYGVAKATNDPTASEFGDSLFRTQHQSAEFPKGEDVEHDVVVE